MAYRNKTEQRRRAAKKRAAMARVQGLEGDGHTQVPWVEAAIAVGFGVLLFALVRTANPQSA